MFFLRAEESPRWSRSQVVTYHDELQSYLVPHQLSAYWYESAVCLKELDEVRLRHPPT
jgi:homospermidine synthase